MSKLQHALQIVSSDLSLFATSRNYASIFADVFGRGYSKAAAHAIQAQLRYGDLSQLARVEVVSAAVMGSARAAYASANGTIYVNDRFLEDASQAELREALLEEFGHAIDARVNASDRPGDEGELFSLLVRGITPTASERKRILEEDDRTTITIQGRSLVVEQAAPLTYTATHINVNASSSSYGFVLSGQNAAWLEQKGSNYLLKFFDGNNISTIANSPYDKFGNVALSGRTVVYTKSDGQDDEVYRFSGGISTRLTNNTDRDGNVLVDGNTVVWQSYTLTGGTTNSWMREGYEVGEIYRNDGTSTTRITNNSVREENVQLSGNTILWAASDGNDYEIYLNDGSTTRALTNNSVDDYSPILQGNRAAWLQYNSNGQDNLFYFDGRESRQVTNNLDVSDPVFSGSNLVFRQWDEAGQATLKFYSSATGEIRQLNNSNTFVTEVATSNNLVAWIEAPRGTNLSTSTKTLKLFNGTTTTSIYSSQLLGPSYLGASGGDITLIGSKLLYLKRWDTPFSSDKDLYLYESSSSSGSSTRLTSFEFEPRDPMSPFYPGFWSIEQISSAGDRILVLGQFGLPGPDRLYMFQPSTNNSLPVISTSVSPTTGVAEDGPTNLTFTLSRTGSTTSPLNVHVNLSGSASANDYTQPSGFSGSSGVVTFNTGSSTATITIDPTADGVTEPNETVTLSIAESGGYSIGASSYATGLILDDDTYTTREEQGNSKLLSRDDGNAFVEVAGSRKEISSPWSTKVGNDSSDWQMIAAEIIGGVNQILWRNNTYNFLHTWTLDSNWNWSSSGGTDTLNSPAAWDLETNFQVDANRDGIIGRYASIENRGNTQLLRRSDGTAVVEVAGNRKEVTSPWGARVGNDSSDWQMIASETINGVNQILWRNNTYNFLHTWTLDANWSWTSSGGTFNPVSTEGFALQEAFGL